MNPVEEFLELQKQAGFLDGAKDVLSSFGRGVSGARSGSSASQHIGNLAHTMGRQVPTALTAMGLTAVGMGATKGITALARKFSKQRDYKAMMQNNPDLRERDAGHVHMVYNSLHRMAPTMAGDPLVAGSFVRDILQLSPETGPAIPPNTVKLLAESQRSLSQARSGDLGPLSQAFVGGRGFAAVPQQVPAGSTP